MMNSQVLFNLVMGYFFVASWLKYIEYHEKVSKHFYATYYRNDGGGM